MTRRVSNEEADQKEAAVLEILRHPSFPTDSEEVISLCMGLYKLPLEDLLNLQKIVAAKEQLAQDEVVESYQHGCNC